MHDQVGERDEVMAAIRVVLGGRPSDARGREGQLLARLAELKDFAATDGLGRGTWQARRDAARSRLAQLLDDPSDGNKPVLPYPLPVIVRRVLGGMSTKQAVRDVDRDDAQYPIDRSYGHTRAMLWERATPAIADWLLARHHGRPVPKESGWEWRLDDDFRSGHWDPPARGVTSSNEHGYRFRGRRRALQAILDWLEAPAPRRVLVVTGSPGAGKSAVLSRIVTTADPAYVERLPGNDDALRAPAGAVAVAVHARDLTAAEVATQLSAAARGERPDGSVTTPQQLAGIVLQALEVNRAGPFNVIIDALDEARSTDDIRVTVGVVRELVENCGALDVRVVVGVRRYHDRQDLLALFGRAEIIDLDPAAEDGEGYFELQDLVAYSQAALQLAGASRRDNPYNDPEVAVRAARAIADAAEGNFLVAGLNARTHGLTDAQSAPIDELRTARGLEAAIRAYLERLSPHAMINPITAMRALAHAEAAGFTASLWASATTALEPRRPVSAEGIEAFAESPAANFLLQDTPAGGDIRYRLFHQALNDTLLSPAFGDRIKDARRIYRRFHDLAHATGWAEAPGYFHCHLAHHAAMAGYIDELLADTTYLLHADLHRLAARSHHACTDEGRQRAQLVRLSLDSEPLPPVVRAARFSVTNAIDHLNVPNIPVEGVPYRGTWATTPTRQEYLILEGHRAPISALCELSLGEGVVRLASAGMDGTVRLWDPTTGSSPVPPMVGHNGVVLCVAAVSLEDGTALLASGGLDGTIRLWNPATGFEVRGPLTAHPQGVTAICAARMGQRTLFASGGVDRQVRFWEIVDGVVINRLASDGVGPISTLCFVLVSDRILVGIVHEHGLAAQLWDPITGARDHLKDYTCFRALSVITSSSSQLLAGASIPDEPLNLPIVLGDDPRPAPVRLWNAATRELFGSPFQDHDGQVRAVCAVPSDDGTLVASGGTDETIRLWDPKTSRAIGSPLRGHAGPINALAAVTSKAQTLVASGGHDGTVRLWPVQTRPIDQLSHTERFGDVTALNVLSTQDHLLVVVATTDQVIRLRDATTGAAVGTPLEGHSARISSLCIVQADDRTLLASGSWDRTVRLWDLESGSQVGDPLLGHEDWVEGMCTLGSPNQVRLMSAGRDGTIRSWNPLAPETCRTHVVLREGSFEQKAQFGEPLFGLCVIEVDGNHLLAGPGVAREVLVWDPRSQVTLGCPVDEGPWPETLWIRSICAIRVGSRTLVASGTADGKVCLSDPLTSARVRSLEGHAGVVRDLCAVTIDGRDLLVSASEDRTVRIWDPLTGSAEFIIPVGRPAYALAASRRKLFVGLSGGLLAMELLNT